MGRGGVWLRPWLQFFSSGKLQLSLKQVAICLLLFLKIILFTFFVVVVILYMAILTV